jgi:L-ascorbate metabolism protein UlaG (beta-lactamase superfamily)
MYHLDERTVPAGRLAVHWFEQSAFAVKNADGVVVLVDPYFPSERTPDRYVHLDRPVDPATLRPDVVLLTHDHSDHTHPESIAAIAEHSPRTLFVGPSESVKRIVSECGVASERARTIAAGDTAELAGIAVHAVYSKPPGGDPKAGIGEPNTTHLGYVVDTGGRRLYFSGDPINTLADLPDLTEPIRSLRPEIGFITTHPTEGEFPFFDGARRLAEAIGLNAAVPSHYECFVKRNYDPAGFVEAFGSSPVQVTVIPWNKAVEL